MAGETHGKCFIVLLHDFELNMSIAAPGFNPRLPGLKINFIAKGLGAAMWFFIFYRMR